MPMVTCDYLIIGSGFAGIGLKYKLQGKTVLIDKNPFSYKIGESHIPNLFNCDLGLFSLIPKIMEMKSYTRKLGSIFCDSHHGRHASNFATPLRTCFACHAEREEIERLLARELSVEIRQEAIVDIDLSKNIVTTDQNKYRFKKYLLDCSGPAMIIANKLNLVTSIDKFQGMKAQWSYWSIDKVNKDRDSWANWTVLNKIAADSWIWQIPIYNNSILSMGMLHRGEPLEREALIDFLQKRSAACYQLTSIARNPQRAIKPYMKEVHSRLHYSKRSMKCSGENWILVGDAYCFADPVYSVGSGVAMLEAVTIANNLNANKGKLDHVWYEKSCNALLETVIKGIGTWYSGTAFDKKVNEEVNRTILQGGFARHFTSSNITEEAKDSQIKSIDAFSTSVEDRTQESLRSEVKVFYFDKNVFVKKKGALSVINDRKLVPVANKAVQKVVEQHMLGKKLSLPDLYLLVELNLSNIEDKDYFWKFLRLIELIGSKTEKEDRLYYFHPDQYEMVGGSLKLGDNNYQLVLKDQETIAFFEKLKGRIFFGKELMKSAQEASSRSPQIRKNTRTFLKKFYKQNTFGNDFVLKADPAVL